MPITPNEPPHLEPGMTYLQAEIASLLRQGYENTLEIADLVHCQPDWVRKTKRQFYDYIYGPTGQESSNRRFKVSAQLQKTRDDLRVERKQFREEIRYHNALSELNEGIIEALELHKGFDTIIHPPQPGIETEGILQISDIHFNELIDMPYNKFDFRIAAQRLEKLVSRARIMFDAHGVQTVHVCFTGDMVNSDRRLDEMMSMATNRAKASVLGAMILKQVLLDLNGDYNLKVYMVTGNESRMHKEMGSTEMRQSDNYDTIIHEMLRMMFLDKLGVEFVDGSCIEQPIRVMGHTILLMHGHQIKMSGVSSQMQRLKGKWSDYLCKETIDYVLFGHFHTSRITDLFARSGGLCGANAYSDNQLQLSSRASQNIFLVERDGINGMKIDLQHSDDFDGYSIDPLLETYNVSSYGRSSGLLKRKRI
jgi:predicted phosphodiesterase